MNLYECAANFVADDTDVIIYSGPIDRDGYDKICGVFNTPRRSKLLLVLSTYGGDPNAGYRIARAAIHHYEASNFQILIPCVCKSAGTLICIGANGLVMADQSELGPLDIQLRKQDELFQQSSGLDILRGVTYLQNEALASFKSYLLDINGGSGLSTKVASEISSKLVIGLYEPLFAQVDPIKLGEMNAALQIARHYGERLNKKSNSLKPDSLNRLIMGYPTHGFVIDRSEAKELFQRVNKPGEREDVVSNFARDNIWGVLPNKSSAIVLDFNELFKPQQLDGSNDGQLSTDDAASEPDADAAETSNEPVTTNSNEGVAIDDEQQ